MTFDAKQAWEKCRQIIRDNILPEQYKCIFHYLEYFDYVEEGRKLTLSVPSSYLIEVIEKEYMEIMRQTIRRVFGENIALYYKILKVQSPKVEIEVKSTDATPVKQPTRQTVSNTAPDPADAENPQDIDSQLRPNYNFQTYLEGESNRLARSIGEAIGKTPAKTFNPFFIYGPSGCGKTHLINAIGLRIKELHPQLRVLYVSAHLFMVQWTDAVRKNLRNDFIAFYQTIDVLIIDDVQELSGKKDTQNTFFHIFNHLQLNNKQIILSSDRPPMAIEGIEDRLLTRFKWGLIAEIEKPTKQLRLNILTAKVSHEGLRIPKNVLNFISENVDDSVRDLEGMVNSLMAYSVVYNCNIDMNLVNKVIPKFKKGVTANTNYTFDYVRDRVCEHFGVTPEMLNSRSRKQPLAYIRQLAIFLVNKLTDESNIQIGLKMGGRNHATVIHSINTIKDLSLFDQKTQQDLQAVQELL